VCYVVPCPLSRRWPMRAQFGAAGAAKRGLHRIPPTSRLPERAIAVCRRTTPRNGNGGADRIASSCAILTRRQTHLLRQSTRQSSSTAPQTQLRPYLARYCSGTRCVLCLPSETQFTFCSCRAFRHHRDFSDLAAEGANPSFLSYVDRLSMFERFVLTDLRDHEYCEYLRKFFPDDAVLTREQIASLKASTRVFQVPFRKACAARM